MRRITRLVTVAATGVLLAAMLSGCQFVGDVLEGQRITNERLGVDAALRELAAELAGLDGVESAVYGFDAADFSTQPGVHVELSTSEFAAWEAVIVRIEATGASDALAGYALAASLEGGGIRADFAAERGTGPGKAALDIAADAVAAFPGSTALIQGAEASVIDVAVPDAAEVLLARMDTSSIGELLARARRNAQYLQFTAEGLVISAAPSPEFTRWALTVLAHEVPRLPTHLSGAEEATPEEWVQLTYGVSGAAASFGGYWSSAVPLRAGGVVWDSFATAVRDGVPVASDGTCPAVYLSYGWPGARSWPSVSSSCGSELGTKGVSAGEELDLLAEALLADGIDLASLGLTLW